MDGYALRSADAPKAGPFELTLIGAAFAGRPSDRRVGEGECVRIMTGAPAPDGADSMVMQEHVSADHERALVVAVPAHGANVRLAGEDIRAGDVVLSAGVHAACAHRPTGIHWRR